jgi:ATP-dependent RNA helicase HelY
MEYAAMRRKVTELEKAASKVRRHDRRSEAEASLEQLRPGDVIVVPVGKFAGPAVVVDPGLSEQGHRPLVITAERQGRRLAMMDFPVPVEPVARIRLPKRVDARNPHQRKDIAQAVREAVRSLPLSVTKPRADRGTMDADTAREVAELRSQIREHPCHGCSDREDHARWAERHAKLQKDTTTLEQRIERRTNTVARTFDRVCEVLEALDYLDGDTVTDRGRGLMRIYSDLDLVAAESLRTGLWDDLNPQQLGAVLSALVYEARRPEEGPPNVPGGAISTTIDAMTRLWGELEVLERTHRLDFLRKPDPGFAWTGGEDLDEILTRNDQTAGDFVRQMKQLIDFAGQIADAAAGTPVRDTARALVKLLRRGIVASE